MEKPQSLSAKVSDETWTGLASAYKKQIEQPQRPSAFRIQKFQNEARLHWSRFYNRNEDRFFKDRQWTHRECPELLQPDIHVLEIGCGAGNFLWPIYEKNPQIKKLYACDFAASAVDVVKRHEKYVEGGVVEAFFADITADRLVPEPIPPHSMDIVTLLFVLSAIRPIYFSQVMSTIKETLRPGGIIFFRDYAVLDHTQLRFKSDQILEENMYLRTDGTMSYFFSEGLSFI